LNKFYGLIVIVEGFGKKFVVVDVVPTDVVKSTTYGELNGNVGKYIRSYV
jgi:hypothetical protein